MARSPDPDLSLELQKVQAGSVMLVSLTSTEIKANLELNRRANSKGILGCYMQVM
jgi:hypothetical protein